MCVCLHMYVVYMNYASVSPVVLQTSPQVLRIVLQASQGFLSFEMYMDGAKLAFYLHALRAKAGWEMNWMQISTPTRIGTIEGSLYYEGCHCYGNYQGWCH